MGRKCAIQDLCNFLNNEVLKNICMEKPRRDPEEKEEFVCPVAYEGYLPPNNQLPEGYAVPAVVVGIAEGEDGEEVADITIQMTFSAFAFDGTYKKGETISKMQGYCDLLHFITTVRAALLKKRNFEAVSVKKPFKYKMYEEQPYPYWYATATFKMDILPFSYENNFLEGGNQIEL